MMMGFGFLLLLLLGGAVVVVLLGEVGLLSRKGSNNQWLGGSTNRQHGRSWTSALLVVRSARRNMKQTVHN